MGVGDIFDSPFISNDPKIILVVFPLSLFAAAPRTAFSPHPGPLPWWPWWYTIEYH